MPGPTLIEAAQTGDLDAARRAIEAGADLHERDADPEKEYPPLMWAARNGHADVVRLLIEHGAEIEQVEREPRPELVQHAIETGRDPDKLGVTAVAKAAYNGHYDVVKVLVDNGADLSHHFNGETALHSAVNGGSREIVEYLLDHGADIDAFHPNIGTPLAVAARGHVDIVRILIARGADLDRKNEMDIEGYTPLMVAAEQSSSPALSPEAQGTYVEIARMLVEAGSDLDARNASDHTALDMCDLPEMKTAIRRAAVRRRVRGLLQRIGLGRLMMRRP